jgi:hypothetical protein
MKSLFIAILMINTSWAASKHCLPNNPSYCTNDKVIVDDGLQGSVGKKGKIVAIYESNETLEIQFKDGSPNQTMTVDNIADTKEHLDAYGFSIGNQPGLRIVTDTGLYGEVVGKYPNGDAEISFNLNDKLLHRWPMARLAVDNVTFCTTGYTRACVKDFVAGKNETQGKVVAVFTNTPYAMVQFFDKNSRKAGRTLKPYKINSSDLIVTIKCAGKNICNHL